MELHVQLWSDLHLDVFKWRHPQVAGDITVMAGDYANGRFSRPWFESLFQSAPHHEFVIVLGNHDFYMRRKRSFDEGLASWIEFFARFPNAHLLHRSEYSMKGVRFVGCTLWYESDPRGTKDSRFIRYFNRDELYEADMEFLKRNVGSSQRTVVVTHHPPPVLFEYSCVWLCGHVHRSSSTGTLRMNPRLDPEYKKIKNWDDAASQDLIVI